MTQPSNHGARSRQPVVHHGRRVPGLYERVRKDGSTAYDYNVRINKRMKRGKIEALTKGDAVREFRRLLSDRDYGVERENRLLNPTMAELLDEYLADAHQRTQILDGKGRMARKTYRLREYYVRVLVKPSRLGRLRVADVTTWDIRDLATGLQSKGGYAPKVVSNVIGMVSLALDLAFERGYVERNVARDLPSKYKPGQKRRTEPRYLTLGEVESLLAAAEDYYRPVFACCAYAALRISEVLGLQWECLDFKADRIAVRQQADEVLGEIVPYVKTDASADDGLPMMPALKRELLAHRSRMAASGLQLVRPEALVFVGMRSGRMLRNHVTYGALRRAGEAAGLNPPGEQPIGHHDLRHTAASLALECSAHEEAAEFMRHASASVTLAVYSGLNSERKGAAARKLLDAGFGA